MIILKEAALLGADPFIYPGSEHKKGDDGNYYGYCSIYPSFKDYEFNPRRAENLDYYFSFNVKTGEINFTGYPWDFIQKDLKKKPYPPELVAFLQKGIPTIAKYIKHDDKVFYVNGVWTDKEPKFGLLTWDAYFEFPSYYKVESVVDKKGITHYWRNVVFYPSREKHILINKDEDAFWDQGHIFENGWTITIELFPDKKTSKFCFTKKDKEFVPNDFIPIPAYTKELITTLTQQQGTLSKLLFEGQDLIWTGSGWKKI